MGVAPELAEGLDQYDDAETVCSGDVERVARLARDRSDEYEHQSCEEFCYARLDVDLDRIARMRSSRAVDIRVQQRNCI